MAIKIENKKVSVEIFGIVYDLKMPTVKDMLEDEEKVESMNSKEKTHYVKRNLIRYGIPEDVVDQLDTSAVSQIIEHVTGSKKN